MILKKPTSQMIYRPFIGKQLIQYFLEKLPKIIYLKRLSIVNNKFKYICFREFYSIIRKYLVSKKLIYFITTKNIFIH